MLAQIPDAKQLYLSNDLESCESSLLTYKYYN